MLIPILFLMAASASAQLLGPAKKITTGAGAPSATMCQSASDAGKVYINKDTTTKSNSYYHCMHNGTSWGWVLTGGAGGGGEANTGSNLSGGSQGVFFGKSGVDLQFRPLGVGSGKLTIGLSGNAISFDVGALAAGDVTTGIFDVARGGLGADASAFTGVIKMASGVASVVTGNASDCVHVDGGSGTCGGAGSGEANTASNVGGGTGLFRQKTGVDLEFKTLVAGSSKLTLSAAATTVTLDVALLASDLPAHASRHAPGGPDTVGTSTPTADSVVQSTGAGTIAAGWIPTLDASKIGTGTIAPARIIGTVTNNRCIHTDGSGNLVVAASDCNTGGAAAVATPDISGGGTSTITMGANCTSGAPCNIGVGEVVYSITASFACQITAGTGADTVFVYLDNAGFMSCGSTNRTISCSGIGGCQVPTGVTNFPFGAVPLYQVTATATTYDTLTGAMDKRPILSTPMRIVTSTGLTFSTLPGELTLLIDTGVVPRKGVSNTFTVGPQIFNGSGASAAALRLGSQSAPSSPSNGDIWLDSGSGTFKFRQNGATAELGGGGGNDIFAKAGNFEYAESFCTGAYVAGHPLAHRWVTDAPTVTIAATDTEAPCGVRVQTGASAGTLALLMLKNNDQISNMGVVHEDFLSSRSWKFAFVFETKATVTGMDYWFGLFDDANSPQATSGRSGFFLTWRDGTDTNWTIVRNSNASNTNACVASEAPQANTTYWLEFSRTTGDISANLWKGTTGLLSDATTSVISSCTFAVPATATAGAGYSPGFGIRNTPASDRVADFQYFAMQLQR